MNAHGSEPKPLASLIQGSLEMLWGNTILGPGLSVSFASMLLSNDHGRDCPLWQFTLYSLFSLCFCYGKRIVTHITQDFIDGLNVTQVSIFLKDEQGNSIRTHPFYLGNPLGIRHFKFFGYGGRF